MKRRAKMERICTIAVAVIVFLTPVLLWAGGLQEESGAKLRVAAIVPGSIQDADYNTLGYRALQQVGDEYSVETAYSEPETTFVIEIDQCDQSGLRRQR